MRVRSRRACAHPKLHLQMPALHAPLPLHALGQPSSQFVPLLPAGHTHTPMLHVPAPQPPVHLAGAWFSSKFAATFAATMFTEPVAATSNRHASRPVPVRPAAVLHAATAAACSFGLENTGDSCARRSVTPGGGECRAADHGREDHVVVVRPRVRAAVVEERLRDRHGPHDKA